MFEMDKAAFGRFLAEQRKAKGYTQRELAGQLFISDKAVSKWERGLSMPDISLLIPLADILEVSVTELLEGRRLDHAAEMDADQVERLVKKALTLSEDAPQQTQKRRIRHAAILLTCALLAALELVIGHGVLLRLGMEPPVSDLLPLEGMSLGFGIYFWLFTQERLPAYYDQNRISAYSDGPIRLNLPGIALNNANWPHILRALRLWSAISLVALPLLALALCALLPGAQHMSFALPIAYVAGLFIPVYAASRNR